jgi:putative DNA modification/repair radical SAM protein
MDIFAKLKILSDAAKYDAACTSSGVDKKAACGGIGSASACGICHTFAGDGRCVSLLKVLFTNICIYDCKYCVNRRSAETKKAAFTPRELADLAIQFYRRNYIEGLFLSSGVIKSPDYTCEQMIETLRILREEYKFNGYIHAKAIPGADSLLIARLGTLADRMSVNIEMPSQNSLQLLAPDKSKHSILTPMSYIKGRIEENCHDLVKYRHAPKFAPAGQSTQMIIGASPETDRQILNLTEGLYRNYNLKRVFFSAYIPVIEDRLLPSIDTKPPLWREHRLYQADWLLRFYGFAAKELLDEENENFHPYVDPKCNWALHHMEFFPMDVNRAPFEDLLRIPGVGVRSAQRIIAVRRSGILSFAGLKKLGVVMKRAQYFISCRGHKLPGLDMSRQVVLRAMMSAREAKLYGTDLDLTGGRQLSLFEPISTSEIRTKELIECLPLPM